MPVPRIRQYSRTRDTDNRKILKDCLQVLYSRGRLQRFVAAAGTSPGRVLVGNVTHEEIIPFPPPTMCCVLDHSVNRLVENVIVKEETAHKL